jgi:cytidine deaminase
MADSNVFGKHSLFWSQQKTRIGDQMEQNKIKELISIAMKQLQFSYAPYSDFYVGAALLTKNGRIYTGCNIENAVGSPGNCAERTAFFKAVSEGEQEFSAICIVGGKEGQVTDYTPPCGVCRQVMMEFCNPKQFEIILAINEKTYKIYRLEELYPLAFSSLLL